MKNAGKKLWIVVTAAIFIFAVAFIGWTIYDLSEHDGEGKNSVAVSAYAEELTDTTPTPPTGAQTGAETAATDETDDDASDVQNAEDSLVDAFIEYLREEYGEEYQKYYDAIVFEWGSIKAYLESFTADGTLTGEAAGAWTAFVGWLDEYSVIWAPALAVAAVIVFLIAGRGVYNALKKLFSKLFKGSNQTAQAQLAIIDALETLLGNTEKTKEQRSKLDEAKKELMKDE